MNRARTRANRSSYLWLLPARFLGLAFYGYSLLFAIRISTQSYNMLRMDRPFVGAANFVRYLTSPDYWRALLVTVRFLAVVMVLVLAVSLGLALMLRRDAALRGLYRGLLMVPWMLSISSLTLPSSRSTSRRSATLLVRVASSWMSRFSISCLLASLAARS